MLATETARNPFARNNMTSSLHSRGYVNGSTISFGSSSLASQPSRYGSNSTMRSQDDEKGIFPPPIPSTFSPPPPESIQPDMNIMNRRADSNSSLYMICMNLRSRLADVPGFEDHIAEMEEEEAAANGSLDPVTLMWNFLRRGYPLITIYNALRLSDPIYFDQTKLKESKVGKAATFKFLEACMRDLKFEPSECFLITDLYGEDTTGFVKVTKVVNRVLDILKQKGLLHHNGPSRTSAAQSATQVASHRQMIIDEIVRTERDYVQHLEMLQQFQNGIQQSGALPGDAVHDIFLNLNALLDFQRRFLIRIEQQNSLLELEQNWGKLFSYYKDGFRVYEPFLANQNRCNDTVIKEWNKLRAAPISADKGLSGICATPAILLGFLLKPFQRLSKYPLLLNELVKHGAYEDELHQDLVEGHAAAQSMMERAEEAVGRENRLAAVSELQSRVEDWKGHKIDHFGELLMFGSYTVLKGEGVKEVEREYKIYLFERILLCCKEINPNKAKNKMLSSNKPLVDKKGKPKLQLKGRIFMQNVTDVAYIMNKKSETPTFTLQIFWKGDPGVENFIIRFNDEATMKKWQDTVRAQQKILTESARSSGQTGTSATEFSYLKSQPSLKNPYREVEEDDDDDVPPTYSMSQGPSASSMSRNASSNSLRSMQTGRMPPPRYPQQEQGNGTYTPPLSLNTNIPPGASSPAEFAGNSYFSPSNDSPVSTRSNSQQSMYPFPRTQAPASEWPRDANKHRTAPAIGRAPSREGPGPPNSYVLDGRTVTRPSLPAMAASQYAQQQMSSTQSRLRSASTPDIQSVPGPRRQANGENVPVPPIPAHMVQMRAPVNRSHTTSPLDAQLPIRSATQSPAIQRDRGPQAYQDQASYDPYGQRLQQEYGQGAYTDMAPPVAQNPAGAISSENGIPLPPQLKVTIWFDPHPSHVTIVVPIIIKHRSLIDRIDSKMVKVSAASIAKGTARLRYKDSDGDIVTIRSDEDVHIAIEDWGTANEDQIRDGVTPDFQLYWQQN